MTTRSKTAPGRPLPCELRTGYLGLGSNVGNRDQHLLAAIELLSAGSVVIEAVSSGYETEPVGLVLDQPNFLNAAVRIHTALDPIELLDLCKRVEVDRGRDLGGVRHGPRPLDVDVLLLGDIEMNNERLTLPHREVTTRRFVLAPLLELDPDLELPDGTRLADAMAGLGEGQEVRLAGPLETPVPGSESQPSPRGRHRPT